MISASIRAGVVWATPSASPSPVWGDSRPFGGGVGSGKIVGVSLPENTPLKFPKMFLPSFPVLGLVPPVFMPLAMSDELIFSPPRNASFFNGFGSPPVMARPSMVFFDPLAIKS